MFLVSVGILFMVMGLMLYLITYIMPIFRLVFLDWIALFIMIVPWFITLYRIKSTRCWHQVDKLPIWKHLIKYLRRDNEMVELLGERAYPGESFIDVKELGLIEFLGKDCFYSCGDKKFIWGLENINFTADPRYWNFCHLLYELGFNDSEDVKRVLTGEDLELMGKVYLNILRWDGGHGVNRLVSELQQYDGPPVVFDKPKVDHRKVADMVDNITGKMPKVHFTFKPAERRRYEDDDYDGRDRGRRR